MIRDLDQADAKGARLCEVRSEVAKLNADYEKETAAVREKFESEIKPLEAEELELAEEISAFFAARPEDRDAGAPQTLTLTSIKISERITADIEWPDKVGVPKLIAKIKKLNLQESFLRIKEDLDKTAIKKAKDEMLKKLGLTRIEKSSIKIEPRT